ncbi:MAG: SDR family NAD(P)-dependent oxidoreductase, partial [Robiginitalea sp.]
MRDLKGKVSYITGGSKGIGYGVAETLLKQGMRVAISGRNKQDLEKASKRLGETNVLSLVSDVCNIADEKAAVQKILDRWGRLDVVVANAGVGHFAPVDQLEVE